jgi:hypothetical protein
MLEVDNAIQYVNGEGELDLRAEAKDVDVSTVCVIRSDIEQGTMTGTQGTMTGTQKMTVDCCIQETVMTSLRGPQQERVYLGGLWGSSASIVWNFGTTMILITDMSVTGRRCKG